MADRMGEHGQPNPYFGKKRVTTRKMDEFIGICRGILADGVLVQEEAVYLLTWLDRNDDAANQWPANVLYQYLQEFLKYGVLDSEGESSLIHKMIEILGEIGSEGGYSAMSTALPFDEHPPIVIFADRTFCLTGKFSFGSRKKCQSEILRRGGKTCENPTRNTDYVVIGGIGSRNWLHSTHGKKIERAVQLRAEGQHIAIVSEKHWSKHL